VKVVTMLVTPIDAEKLTLASREGLLRLAMRNYSDGKIVATRGIGLTDLLHEGGLPASTLPVMQIQPAPGLTARPAHGPTGFRIEVMRDGKSSEAMQFVHSGMASHSSFQVQQDTPAVAEPPPPAPAPALPDAPEAPVSSAKPVWSASFAAPPPSAFAAVRRNAIEGRPLPDLAPLRPGDPGYMPAPKTYQVP
jgi:hypothetical protein